MTIKHVELTPHPTVFVGGVTFFGRGYGILVFRSPHDKKNPFFCEVGGENAGIYRDGRKALEAQGYVFQAVALDGRKGVREVFSDIPVQMCHFHQTAILKRYLTSRPKLEAGQELRAIGKTLLFITEPEFTCLLDEWYERWVVFLRERTYAEDGKHFHYTHKKIRSAYRGLRDNLPFLFTYQKHPELHIPRTTNSLDGFFGQMKTLLRVHRGLSKKRRWRVIQEILRR